MWVLKTYYPQGNGHVKSTNKVLRTLLTKLVSENIIDWDEHLYTLLFSYRNCIQNNNKVYTISISVWITSINAHKVHHSSC
jgi:hypothetical protein